MLVDWSGPEGARWRVWDDERTTVLGGFARVAVYVSAVLQDGPNGGGVLYVPHARLVAYGAEAALLPA